MRKRLRTPVYLLLGTLAALMLILLGIYQALLTVPGEYRNVLKADPKAQREASDEMLQQIADLLSDLRQQRDWDARLTEAQINGWLAVDLVENHPDALLDGLSEPRVVIRGKTITIYCRTRRGNMETVLTLMAEPYLDLPNVLGLRLRKARVGLLPLPLGNIVQQIGHAARDLELKLNWRQTDGDPVALITIPETFDDGSVFRIDHLRIRDGELHAAGGNARLLDN